MLPQLINKLPDFMIGNLLELLGVLLASVLLAIYSTFVIDKRRVIKKVQAKIMDLRLEQYTDIRSFIELQKKVQMFPESQEATINNLKLSGFSFMDSELFYSSRGIANEENIKQTLNNLENLTMNGLYILDDDTLKEILQIKIYVKNIHMFSYILSGYHAKYNNKTEQIEVDEYINQVSELFYHHLSILLNREYQNMIEKLQRLVIQKASKPKFERKSKNYRKIKRRKILQEKALAKTILQKEYPKFIHLLASLYSAYSRESENQQKETLAGFYQYVTNFLKSYD